MSMSPLRTNLCLPETRMAADDETIPCLDGLRAVSIALVVCTHFVTNEIPGGLGVTTFFFISGFLIARLLFAEWKSTGRIDLRAFYIRRFLRLYPVIVAYVIFTIAVALWLRAPIKTVEITSVLFYFANYLYAANQLAGETFVHPIGPFWSLSVEEHFYFFAPLPFIVARSDSTLASHFCRHLRRLANVILNTPIAVWIGRLSYSIYIWHVLVDHFMPHSIPAAVRTILLFVTTLAVACASYYLIERPFLRLRKSFRTTPERSKMHPVTSLVLTVSAELPEALGGMPVHQ